MLLELTHGTIIARQYRVLRTLGSGGFGCVYLVENLLLPGQQLALKLLHSDAPDPAQWRARFVREVEVLSALTHPNIVTIRHFFEHGHDLGYTMDFVEGKSLDALARQAPLSTARVVRLGIDILEALSVAHEHEPVIVHRDMKPHNVMVENPGTDKERARILDFGIAKIMSDQAPALTRGFIGSLRWASPEQCLQQPVDARSDLYSVGCILYQLLTGRLPFEAETPTALLHLHASARPATLSEASGLSFPPSLEAIVGRTLSKVPAERPASAQDLIRALRAVTARPLESELALAKGIGPATGAAAPSAVTPGRSATPRPWDEATLGASLPGGPGTLDDLSNAWTLGPSLSAASGARQVCLVFDAANAGITRLFLFAGTRLAYGRNASPPANADAYVVLRALPCRSEALDRENWQRCLRLSSHHGELSLEADGLRVTDSSSAGTLANGQPLHRGVPRPVGEDRCVLSLAQGALELECQGIAGTDGRPSALIVRRIGNCEGHVYVLVRDALTFGGSAGADLPLAAPAAGSVRVHNAGGRLIAQECSHGASLTTAQGTTLGTPAGLEPGALVRLGSAHARVVDVSLERFVTP